MEHCWISAPLRRLFKECTHLEVDFGVEESGLYQCDQLEVGVYPANKTEKVSKHLLHSFHTSFCNIHLPILVPADGQRGGFTLDGEQVEVCWRSNVAKSEQRCGYFWLNSLPNITWVPLESIPKGPQLESKEEAKLVEALAELQSSSPLKKLGFQTDLIDSIQEVIIAKLRSPHPLRDHILLVGASGSGKSSILTLLSKRMFGADGNEDLFIFSHLVDCLAWKGRSSESIHKELSSTLKALRCRSPSLLFLDNFDFLNCPAEGEEEQYLHAGKIYSKIIETIEKANVLCLCSVERVKGLSEWITCVNGRRFFSHQFVIEGLNKSQQLSALGTFLGHNRPLDELDFEKELNFSVGHLAKIAQSIRLQTAYKEIPTLEDIVQGLANAPAISQGVPPAARDERSVGFADIGGMHGVKQQLVEIFIWPTKYPKLFSSCGIKIGTGAILFGPSSCGKTMLMRAMTRETGFNVINIKGPELLSKYIGQSEENVRRVFERARSSRPCILAFDEFDALAPIRGHDSTGVTDRVVNQLLTEMDGVDDSMGRGVYVLAATNRIQLIDQALLRPGRFDHKIYVGVPNENDRLSILQLHSKGLLSDSEEVVELLQELAQRTANWTGSELRGLILNAQFQKMGEEEREGKAGGYLQRHHIESVFHSSKPKATAQPAQSVKPAAKRVTQA